MYELLFYADKTLLSFVWFSAILSLSNYFQLALRRKTFTFLRNNVASRLSFLKLAYLKIKNFGTWSFFDSPFVCRNFFLGHYDLLFLGITACRIFVLDKFFLREFFLGNCHPTSGNFQCSVPNVSNGTKVIGITEETFLDPHWHGKSLIQWRISLMKSLWKELFAY